MSKNSMLFIHSVQKLYAYFAYPQSFSV